MLSSVRLPALKIYSQCNLGPNAANALREAAHVEPAARIDRRLRGYHRYGEQWSRPLLAYRRVRADDVDDGSQNIGLVAQLHFSFELFLVLQPVAACGAGVRNIEGIPLDVRPVAIPNFLSASAPDWLELVLGCLATSFALGRRVFECPECTHIGFMFLAQETFQCQLVW